MYTRFSLLRFFEKTVFLSDGLLVASATVFFFLVQETFGRFSFFSPYYHVFPFVLPSISSFLGGFVSNREDD